MIEIIDCPSCSQAGDSCDACDDSGKVRVIDNMDAEALRALEAWGFAMRQVESAEAIRMDRVNREAKALEKMREWPEWRISTALDEVVKAHGEIVVALAKKLGGS